MEQNPLTVIVRVRQGVLPELRERLAAIGDDVEKNPWLRFRDSPSTHFARWVILDRDPDRPPRLLFSSNHDGTLAEYAGELAGALAEGLDWIWSRCEGYPAGAAREGPRLLDFLARHSLPAQAFYAACRGASVREIQKAAARREHLDVLLDGPDANAVAARLRQLVPAESPSPPRGDTLVRPGAAGRLIEYLAGIREGPPSRHRRAAAAHDVARIEDRVAQNQMTVVSPIRPGLWPWLFARVVLRLVDYQARRARGSLSGLTTIHFARWLFLDDGRSLLFESNYDGSWESYIDDFVDFASTGMNAIWGTAAGFPRAGCRDIEAFKQVIRHYQVPAQAFYSAYPNSTVRNNLNDLALARALDRKEPHEAVRRFLTGCFGEGG